MKIQPLKVGLVGIWGGGERDMMGLGTASDRDGRRRHVQSV